MLHNKQPYVVYYYFTSIATGNKRVYVLLNGEAHVTGKDSEFPEAFSSAQVCRASGLSRGTFDAWMLRRYMPVEPGPGTGRVREFSILDAVRIALAAELTRLGVSVSIASRMSGFVQDRHLTPLNKKGWVLLLASSSSVHSKDAENRGPGHTLIKFDGLADIQRALHGMTPGTSPASFVMVDVTAVADRTRAALADPAEPAPTKTWLDRQDEQDE